MNENEIRNMIKELLKSKDISETRWITLKKEEDKIWALVIAWQDEFEEEYEDGNEFLYGTYRICGKVAYNDSYMKDYDIDWIMPIDTTTNDVYNTEVSLNCESDISYAISYWIECWEEIKKLNTI